MMFNMGRHSGGGTTPNLQTKSVTITANTVANTPLEITPDNGYDGIEKLLATVAVSGAELSGTFTPADNFRSFSIDVGSGSITRFMYHGVEGGPQYHTSAYMENGASVFGLRGNSYADSSLYTLSGTTVTLKNVSGDYNFWKGGITYTWKAW